VQTIVGGKMTSITSPYGITALTMEDLEKLNVNTVLTHSFADSEFSIKPIQGEPVVVELVLNESELEWLQESERKIKHGLVQKLAEAMYESGKYIEFTRQELFNEQRIVFRARVFVTPGDVTQLLRVNNVIK
jgi:hypothetical protein